MILPGTTVVVNDSTSIYNGYEGFIQRMEKDKAALLIDSHPWEKLMLLLNRSLRLHQEAACHVEGYPQVLYFQAP